MTLGELVMRTVNLAIAHCDPYEWRVEVEQLRPNGVTLWLRLTVDGKRFVARAYIATRVDERRAERLVRAAARGIRNEIEYEHGREGVDRAIKRGVES